MRSKAFDVALLLVTAAAVIVLAIVVPAGR